MRTLKPSYIANFDSATAFLRATARFLKGKDFPALGQAPVLEAIVPLANRLPRWPREALYAVGGMGEAMGPMSVDSVSAEEIAQWVTGLYPRRRYPAVMVGSSSGALTHLCAALGAPWLPQTTFVPVRQIGVHPDDAVDGMEAGREPGRLLLEHNPELQLHHMHDPNQDRLMLHLMTYFRVKRLRLGRTYEAFLDRSLHPGGPIFLVECRRRWPSTKVGERHYYQFGALGGATPEEFMHGSERVEKYLAEYRSHRRRWEPPEPNEDAPEAEWGFEPALRDDVERFARERGYHIVRVVFDEPEDLSPFVADLYRWWYERRRLRPNRLLVESFLLIEPWWALRTGSAPFWMKFNMEPSAEAIERYLDGTEPYDHIHMMLFSHGVECVGLVPIERWRAIIGRARKGGGFVGVDEEAYPRDFASFGRYNPAMRDIPARYPVPGPLSLDQLARFVAETAGNYRIRWHGLDEAVEATARRPSPSSRRAPARFAAHA